MPNKEKVTLSLPTGVMNVVRKEAPPLGYSDSSPSR